MGDSPHWFTLRWTPAGVEMLDQRALPAEERYLTLTTVEEVAGAIEQMVIRGAPAIACAAALGVALVASRSAATRVSELAAEVEAALERLARTRPTAVNLFWALDRMRDRLRSLQGSEDLERLRTGLVEEALRLLAADLETNRSIGAHGLSLVPDGARILTHCNAGALATSGYGTALGVVRAAAENGRNIQVIADETRPFLQGSRLTAWELARDGIPVSVITDGMAGHLMSRGDVDLVIVGADRIAANGAVANKIGTYALAVLAREHGLPFHVAAPLSTVDLATADGAAIPIEQRSSREVEELAGIQLVPEGVAARHPAFDVTPARLVTSIVTEAGIARPPYAPSLAALVAAQVE
jgi:methylthioribose-1-phosphate isomerase